MTDAVYFEPENGWHHFSDSAAILDAIWQNLSEENGEWQYINPTSKISIWEYQADGSYLWIGFETIPDEKIAELYATKGQALNHLHNCIKKFNLRRILCDRQ